MKCIAKGCKNEASKKVKKQWGDKETIGFCDKHTPRWLKTCKIGGLSPKTTTLGITKSWYKRVK